MAKDLNISRLCDTYGMLLTEHRQRVIREFYDYDLSLAEIAENLGITRQAVLCSIKQAEEQLCEYERKLGLVAKTDKLESELNKALDEIDGQTDFAIARLKKIVSDLR